MRVDQYLCDAHKQHAFDIGEVRCAHANALNVQLLTMRQALLTLAPPSENEASSAGGNNAGDAGTGEV
jgi:hypothetical protein